ncbi:MAG: hypothetical protein AAF804_12690, partial [Bacteroidota bacterium]
MKHALSFLIVLLLALTSLLRGQDAYLEGVLMDRVGRSPVAYASLSPSGQSVMGTLSNIDGVFRIRWSAGIDSMSIRHLNYGQLTLELATLGDTIWLQPTPIVLDEVPIFSESPQELWRRVIDNLDDNHYHQRVAYLADSRSMFYSQDRKHLYYLSQSTANLYRKRKKAFPKTDAVSISRKPLSGTGEILAESRYRVMHEVPPATFFDRFSAAFKRSALKDFDIEVSR